MRIDVLSKIEELLNNQLLSMSNQDYLSLLANNKDLKLYDEIMQKIDNGDWPQSYLNKISGKQLSNILNYLENI